MVASKLTGGFCIGHISLRTILQFVMHLLPSPYSTRGWSLFLIYCGRIFNWYKKNPKTTGLCCFTAEKALVY